jgi:hypothetical protein
MPDHLHLLSEHVLKDMLTVMVAIASGKHKNTDLHFFSFASGRIRALIPKYFTSIRTDILQ